MNEQKVLTSTEAAYIAGFMDGEGSFFCIREKRNENRNGVSYVFQVSVVNTNYEVMEWIRIVTDGGRIISENDNHPNHKIKYRLKFNKNWILNIVPQLFDYLVIKKRQANLIIEGILLKEPPNNYLNYNDQRLYQIYRELKELNYRGTEQKYFPFEPVRAAVKKDERLCSYPGCTTIHFGNGYCRKHYKRIKIIQTMSNDIDIDQFHAKDDNRVCKECGKNIPKSKHDGTLFCGTTCLVAYHSKRKRNATIQKVKEEGREIGVCQQCGNNFDSKFASTKYCSDHCRSLSRAVGPVKKTCEQCGVEFLAQRPNRRKFCSGLCSQRNRAERKNDGILDL